MEGLEQEWKQKKSLLAAKKLRSIYFGGGTPYLLGATSIAVILSWIEEAFPSSFPHCEITLEANPEEITTEEIRAYASAGINRVSLGVQTFNDDLLAILGRQHNSQRAVHAVDDIIAGGISNISIDLIYDLPKQTLQHWEETLTRAVSLPITHLSLYNLTIEPHTVFFKKRKQIEQQQPKPEDSGTMYRMAQEKLGAASLGQYEISAFAREGCHSRHNVGYWTGRPFLGFGPSAFSYWGGKRFRNVANISRYHKALLRGDSAVDFEEELASDAKRRELFTIQMRLLQGVHLPSFETYFGQLDLETRENITRLKEEALLLSEGDTVRLSEKGVLFYDTVATELI